MFKALLPRVWGYIYHVILLKKHVICEIVCIYFSMAWKMPLHIKDVISSENYPVDVNLKTSIIIDNHHVLWAMKHGYTKSALLYHETAFCIYKYDGGRLHDMN